MNDQDNKDKEASKGSRGTGARLTEEQRSFVVETFKHGLNFAERLSKTAATLPWTLLESVGVTEEKTRGPKDFNLRLVDGVFRLTNKMAARALAIVESPAQVLDDETSSEKPAPTAKTSASDNARDATRAAAPSKVTNR